MKYEICEVNQRVISSCPAANCLLVRYLQRSHGTLAACTVVESRRQYPECRETAALLSPCLPLAYLPCDWTFGDGVPPLISLVVIGVFVHNEFHTYV